MLCGRSIAAPLFRRFQRHESGHCLALALVLVKPCPAARPEPAPLPHEHYAAETTPCHLRK